MSGRIFILMVLCLAGCKAHPKARPALPTTVPAPIADSRQQQLQLPPQKVLPVKEGNPPIAYLVESDALIRIIDATDGTVLAESPATRRQVVSITDSAGVQIGDDRFKKTAVVASHRYQIFAYSGGENVYRTGVVKPGKQ